jgi:hypothetical protein
MTACADAPMEIGRATMMHERKMEMPKPPVGLSRISRPSISRQPSTLNVARTVTQEITRYKP